MIILLLYMAWTMSEAAADNESLKDIERQNANIVRQNNYIQHISDNRFHNVSNTNLNITLANIDNEMPPERIKSLHKYIASMTKEICSFTCHKCYRCSLVYGELGNKISDNLFLDE